MKIRVGEAGAVTATFAPASRDVLIRDVFAGDTTPEALTTVEFTRTVAESLAPGGLYILNCGDGPALTGARAEAAALLEVFEYVCIVADSAMLKGRRRGNVIIAGSHAPCRRLVPCRLPLSPVSSWVEACPPSTGTPRGFVSS